MKIKHSVVEKMDQPSSLTTMTFKHPFSMIVSGPSARGKSVWTRHLLISSLIQPSPERIIWCFGQWQSLYDDIRKKIPWIEFVKGIPDYLNSENYIDTNKRNLLVFDYLMTEAKCDQRIADLFTRGSHHKNLSVVYLTQNLFPQGKACRDIALNTQYMVLFNNPIDRQQVATLARKIYPSTSAIFMKRFEQATSRPYGYLIIDLKSDTKEQDRLHTDIFDGLSSEEKKRDRLDREKFDRLSSEEANMVVDQESAQAEMGDEEEEEAEEDGYSMKKEIAKFDLPPGRQEHQNLTKHTICFANQTMNRGCFLKALIFEKVKQCVLPIAEKEAEKYYPDMEPELALQTRLEDTISDTRRLARELLKDRLISIYYLEKRHLYRSLINTAERLRRTSHLSAPLAIAEAIRIYKPELNQILIPVNNVSWA